FMIRPSQSCTLFPYTTLFRSPNVRLELVELGAKLIEQLVEEGKIDLGLIVLPVDESIFNIYPFFSDEFVLCIHREHPLANRESRSEEHTSELQSREKLVCRLL